MSAAKRAGLIIGKPDGNDYTALADDYALLIDLGGKNVYGGNAGGLYPGKLYYEDAASSARAGASRA